MVLLIYCEEKMINKMVICKSLGDKAHTDDKIADNVCYCRLFIVLIHIITAGFIVAGVIHNW